MARLEIDESEHPLLSVQFPSTLTGEEFTDYQKRLFAIMERGPVLLLIDSGQTQLDAHLRKMMADQVRNNQAFFVRYCRGCAVIVRSAPTRGVMTALLWLVTPAFPTRSFANEEDARRWLNGLK